MDPGESLAALLCRRAGCWRCDPGLSLDHRRKLNQLIIDGRREPSLLEDMPGQRHHWHAVVCQS
jgi:hypothetical protein